MGALLTAAVQRAGGRALASGVFLGLLIWPNLNFNSNGFEQVVERQFLQDRSYNEPLITFLRQNVRPGETVAFFRYTKGAMAYFYFPEMRWAALLDSGHPRNKKFRGVVPDDQFDDYRDVAWYVLWSTRSAPKGLNEEYEKVWEYSVTRPGSFWRRNRAALPLEYQVYRKVPESPRRKAKPPGL